MIEVREDLLTAVGECILVDRAATHGLPEDSFERIAAYWRVYLGLDASTLTASDVAVMMTLLKVARISNNPKHLDNYVDGAGYLILAGEPHAT